jgi:hypothetical protein
VLGGLRAAGHGRVDDPDSMRRGDACQLVGLRRPDAAHLQPDGVLGPVVEQRLDDLEDDVGGREHRDHDPGAADRFARPFGRLTTTACELAKPLGVAVPGDHRDLPLEQPVGHGGTHQADAQQSDANLAHRALLRSRRCPRVVVMRRGCQGPSSRPMRIRRTLHSPAP